MAPYRRTQIDRFHTPVVAAASAVAESRAAFEGWIATTGASADAVHEMTVVFSELVANAVDASPNADHQIEASAWTEDGTVVLRIANATTPAARPVSTPDLSDPLRTGGRGLMIVRAYTDTLKVESADGTIAIRCERRISG